MLCSGEGNGFFEFVVVSDGMDGLYEPARGPGGGDLDATTANVQGTTSLYCVVCGDNESTSNYNVHVHVMTSIVITY